MAMTTTIDKMLAKAGELEEQAKALRLVAALMGDELTAGKVASAARTVAQASALRKAQRNGHTVVAEPGEIEAAPTDRRRRGAAHPSYRTGKHTAAAKAERSDKREAVFGIIRAYGKPMPLAALKTAAAAQGIDNLTGMYGYVRAGLLKATGRKGKTRYSLSSGG